MDKLNVASIVDACEIKFNVPLRDWNEPELLKFYARYGEQLDISEQQQAKSIELTKKDIANRNKRLNGRRSYTSLMKAVTVIDTQGQVHHFKCYRETAEYIGCAVSYINYIKQKPYEQRVYKGYKFYFDAEGGIDHEQVD